MRHVVDVSDIVCGAKALYLVGHIAGSIVAIAIAGGVDAAFDATGEY
jgi:hypothetical protein